MKKKGWSAPIGCIALIVFALSAAVAPAAVSRPVEGIVIDHETGQGLPDVVVSDGVTLAQTGTEGQFTLDTDDHARFVFVCWPAGYLPIDSDSWYQRIADDASYRFGFSLADEQHHELLLVQLSDLHYASSPEEFEQASDKWSMNVDVEAILDRLVWEINEASPDLVMITGDIVADAKTPDLALVDKWMTYVGCTLRPRIDSLFLAAVGNHDVVRDPEIGKDLFRDTFGPVYYSLNLQGCHLIVLDTQQLAGTSLDYTVTREQLAWLKQDLAAADPRCPILVFCHEPPVDWDETPENDDLLSVLAEYEVAALVTGHWHMNAVLQQEPFPVITSGSVCGSWWDTDAPDGRRFGYRVWRISRGSVGSIWREIGQSVIDLVQPSSAVLQGQQELLACVWGRAVEALYAWDDLPERPADVTWNGSWSQASSALSLLGLDNGYHTLRVRFRMSDGQIITRNQTFLIHEAAITVREMQDRTDVFLGRYVSARDVEVRAAMGADFSATDGTSTVMVSRSLWDVARRDHISVSGLLADFGMVLIKPFDPYHFLQIEPPDEAAGTP